MSREPGRASSAYRRSRAVTMRLAVFGASAVAALPGVIGAQTREDSLAVDARLHAYRAAWNAHDPSAVAAFFTEDADFVMGNQPAAVGRGAIRDWWSDYFSVQEPERHLTLDVNAARFVAADVAVVNVTTTTGGRDDQGLDLRPRRFRGAWVVQRRSGEWMISAMRGLPTEDDRVVLSASPAATEALQPDIRAFIEAYADAFDTHDPSAVSAFYADDADIIVRNGPLAHGRQAINAWWGRYFAEARPYRAILIVEDIRMATQDVALINIVATGSATELAPQGAPVGYMPRYARATWLLARGKEGWLIAALWILPSEDDRIIRGGDR